VWQPESVLKARYFLFVNLYSVAYENFPSYEKTMSGKSNQIFITSFFDQGE